MKALLVTHILSGISALVSMFVPLFARKGGELHRRGGRVYVWSMAGVVISALAVCLGRLLDLQADHQSAYFLGLVGVLAGGNTWYGVRVLRHKARGAAHKNLLDWGVAALTALVGGAGAIYGVSYSHPLFLAFGLLSLSLGVGQMREMSGPWKHKKAWLVAHLSNMIAACIATTTAFLVVNQPRLPAEYATLVPPIVLWLAPTAVGSPLIVWWGRKVSR